MEIVVHSENCVNNLHKNLYHFNRHELGLLTDECDVKNDSIGLPDWEKNPTPTLWSRLHPKKLRPRNSDYNQKVRDIYFHIHEPVQTSCPVTEGECGVN